MKARTYDLQRHRGEYKVPGPNWLWSVDGHCKLETWGIQIYAGIDAYSRYIIWIYVGITARTGVSVKSQYLNVVEATGILPWIIRSDHGGETILMADAHYRLSKKRSSEVTFPKCYYYGTSTSNQRIESWWGQLSKGKLLLWRVRINMLGYEVLILIIFIEIFYSIARGKSV